MDLKERKKLAKDSFCEEMAKLNLKEGVLSFKQGIAHITYPDGTCAHIFYDPITSGFAKGEFGADVTLTITGGPINDALVTTGCMEKSSRRFFHGKSHTLIPKRSTGYKFTGTDLPAKRMKEMIKDVEKHYLPLIESFAGSNYSKALSFSIENPNYLEAPFGTCVAILGLSGSIAKLDATIAKIKKIPEFYDYHRDPKRSMELAKKIGKWTEKHS